MAKTPRTEIVAVRFTPKEREQIQELADRMGGVSLSDCLRAATKMYMKMRLNPQRANKYFAPLLMELVQSGEIAEMDLTPDEPRAQRRRG